MRQALRFLARLYPRSWRQRYADEFDALLEDAPLRWRDIADILWEAIAMQMQSWNFGRVIVALGLAGAVAGAVGSFALPEQYVSQAVLRSQHSDRSDPVFQSTSQKVTSRGFLEGIIEREHLYQRELTQKPMEDVMLAMRESIRIDDSDSGRIAVAFTYSDSRKAQLVVSEIADVIQNELPATEVLDTPSLAGRPVEPNRAAIAGYGLGAGLLLALILGLFRRPSLRRAAALGLAGGLSAWCISFAFPERYVSTGLVVMRNGTDEYFHNLVADIIDDFSLTVLIESTGIYGQGKPTKESIEKVRRNIRIEKAQAGRGKFRITFASSDPTIAQRITALLINNLMAGNARRRPLAPTLEVFDPASMPKEPVSPNRPMVAGIGLGAGVLLSGFYLRRRA